MNEYDKLKKEYEQLKLKYKKIALKYNNLVKIYNKIRIGFSRLYKNYVIMKRKNILLKKHSSKKVMEVLEKYGKEQFQLVFDKNRNIINVSNDFLNEIEMSKNEFAQSFYIDILFEKFLPFIDPKKQVIDVEEFQFPILLKNYDFEGDTIHPYLHFKFSGKLQYLKKRKDFYYFLNVENISSTVELNYFQKTDSLIKSLSISNLNLQKAKKNIEVHKIMLIFLTCSLIEEYNHETSEHLQRIKDITTYITAACKKMHLIKIGNYDLEEYVKDINYTSVLHDIGKMGVPNSVLSKNSRLDKKEQEVMRSHTNIGAQYIKNIIDYLKKDEKYSTYIDFLNIPYEICLYHHEKWDGTGYPDKLFGKQIPISARIVAVADTYDAIRGSRSYDKSRTHEEAVAIITKEAGKQFDPEIVEAFLSIENYLKNMKY